jgi:hypothetical protein
MNKVSPIILPMNVPPRYSLKSFIDTVDISMRKRTTNTPSPPLTPEIYIKPPPPTPIHKDIVIIEKNITITVKPNEENKERESQNESNYIIVKDDMDCYELGQNISELKNTPSINLRYDRLNVHDYIYNYILFAYNFYNPIFTMYITIITYKQQMSQSSSILKNVAISYAIIYPLIAMIILLNEAYYIYCKKFIYYKLMDNGVIFKWKKEYLHNSVYFWWYILSLIFICVGINDSWNFILMFINQTSNLCIYVYNTINIESTLITLNGFFENNINLQTENIRKIIWIDEERLKENVYSMIEAKKVIQKNIDNDVTLLMSSFMKKDDEEDMNILIMENFDKHKQYLHTKMISDYYKIIEKCNPDIDIIGKMKIKRIKKEIIPVELSCHTQFPFYKRKWILTLLSEMKQNYNMYWNHKCINCDLLREMNYFLCIVCRTHLCESCDVLNTKKCLKTCYSSVADMDHKTIQVYWNNDNKFINTDKSADYSWYYRLFYHYNMDNLKIISILDTIYYISILSIFMIEFYGFYIIFS